MLAALMIAGYGTPLATLRVERKRGARYDGPTYRLYLRGRRTSLLLETSSNAVGAPAVSAHRTPGGIVYGSTSRIESGATIVGETIAFVSDRGRFLTKPGYGVATAKGERLLLTAAQDSWLTETSDAYLYHRGGFLKIGPASAVHLESTGRVTGWYLADGRDRPFSGLVSETSEPLYRRYFAWRDGRRSLMGRKPN